MPIASLERVIRPRVSPRIRPAVTPQILPSEDDGAGIARIAGNTQVINLSHSYNSTQSRRAEKEIKRKFDLVRVKNPNDEEQYVDLEVTHKIHTLDGRGLTAKYNFAKPPPAENIEILEEDKERFNSDTPVN
jgi:hypothetical protein